METVRIRGLVKAATTVRRQLTQPATSSELYRLCAYAERTLRAVDEILAGHRAPVEAMSPASQRAYEFLRDVDFKSITPRTDDKPSRPAPGSMRIPGVKSDLEWAVYELATGPTDESAGKVYEFLSGASAQIERNMKALPADSLTPQSRNIRAWLAFFADRVNFQAYRAAMRRAKPAVEESLRRSPRFHAPAFIEFRPLRGLFRIRGNSGGATVSLATPAICFSEELFRSFAQAAFEGGSRQAILEAAVSDEYQDIQAELDALGGLDDQPRGMCHDLAQSFQRVNERYFGDTLSRPRLTWSKTFSGHKLGHYDPLRDTVMISALLDRRDVTSHTLDYLMYHELLHKKLGIDWRNGREDVHTARFYAEERRYEQYKLAELALRTLLS